ncbi:MAG: B12-binding domain-containing radical SAM protein [Desulfobacterales bacterium CG23_combo_of_CG06-09_8_20_14_all_51_8]|nr:MAG: B12-binding domain-containing radical SAM protein [Desulfobacterales bacterium CG23_combo_of_CG06-09_8_20_14_all_51_8]
MRKNAMDAFLPLIEKPSQYLGTEKNAVIKDRQAVRLHFALAFPDVYEIGMSHFGLQILYHILNSRAEIAAERVYAPGLDLAARLKNAGIPLPSLETGTPLGEFDIIGFSLLYEMNYTNVLLMLDLAGIPFYASERDATYPIIIAGGPCTVNPEPVADFFDAMVVGDGETVILDMAAAWMAWKDGGSGDKRRLLRDWSKIRGVYVPAFFTPLYDGSHFVGIRPELDDYPKVGRAIVPDLDASPFPDAPIVPYGRPVHDRLRLEIVRGCTRGCRFCQAGMIYRPVRERSVENLMALAEKSIAATGYEDISLLALSTGDYSGLSALMHRLVSCHALENIALSLPSFRAGTLSPEIMDLIRQIRKTGFTIAPEAGSDRLRAVINKNISEQEIFDTVSAAFDLGWQVIKFYFMIGLPTETQDDRLAIVDLVQRIRRKLKAAGRRPNFHVSIGTFIPKPHVPFQWSSQMPLAESREIIFDLKRRLTISGVEFKWQKPELSILEGLWARGDRRLSKLLETAYRKGCCFDGWSDQFDVASWEAAIQETGIDIHYYTTRSRSVDEPLPWDHIDTGVSREFLKTEYARAFEGVSVPDCRLGECQGCGVCDFKIIQPRIHSSQSLPVPASGAASVENFPETDARYEIFYAKTGPARFFGHLEMVNIFIRAIRRAGLKIKFSEGFHPKPKMSFHNPLPVGMQSEAESFYITFRQAADFEQIIVSVNSQLPEGLIVTGCRHVSDYKHPELPQTEDFRVCCVGQEFDEQRITAFLNTENWPLERTSKKGKKQEINLRDVVVILERRSQEELRLRLKTVEGLSVRPADVIQSIFQFSELTMLQAEIIKEKQKPDHLENITEPKDHPVR